MNGSGHRVGNDIIDLGSKRYAGKAEKRGFVERILAPGEAEAVRSSANPDRTLWMHWAGKETAFKVVTKILGSPPVFEHARFVVHFHAPDPADAGRTGSEGAGSPACTGEVAYGEIRVALHLQSGAETLHCVGWSAGVDVPLREGRAEAGEPGARRRRGAGPSGAGAGPPIEVGVIRMDEVAARVGMGALEEGADWRLATRDRFSARERAALHGRASALVRLAARASCARLLGAAEDDLEIVTLGTQPGRGAPVVLQSGREAPLDLSLSHDGRYVAWAILGWMP